ncbi:MAG TPA: methyltransferase domain-containing protein [Patescibacteria group bacterium]|nr:methyltransferase domain-containing protein [Patescibacteria group bacterium]
MENTNTNSDEVRDPSKIYLPKFNESKIFGSKKIGSEPVSILKEIGISAGETVVDFGSGFGFFDVEAARMVGENGRVIAVDIRKEALDGVKQKSFASGLRNIFGVLADLTLPRSTTLPDATVDTVLIINLLYMIDDKAAVLKEAYRILKPGGKMVIMEWTEKGALVMIEKEHIVAAKDIKELTRKQGFKKLRSFEAGLSHEVNIFVK